MKKFTPTITAFWLAVLMQLSGFIAQSQGMYGKRDFEVIGMPGRQGPRLAKYFEKNDIPIANLLTISAIINPHNPGKRDKIHPPSIIGFLRSRYPDADATDMMVLNWETSVFKDLRNFDKSHERYKYAEGQWRALIKIIREERPNLKIGIYGIPFRVWNGWQKENYNPEGKFDNLLSLCDFLAPSVYLPFPDEEVGHDRNIRYIQANLDIALKLGKKLKMPVYPYVWHRVHFSNPVYGHNLIQKEVLADYVKFISTYTFENQKAKGVVLWEEGELSSRFKDFKSLGNHLKGIVKDPATYDQQMVRYVAAILAELPKKDNETKEQTDEVKISSFSLVDADTEQPLTVITNGATINLATLPSRKIAVEADVDLNEEGSVVLKLSGEEEHSQTESIYPYALFGGTTTDYAEWTPAVGKYTVVATPYNGPGGTGKVGKSLTITFNVVDEEVNEDEQLVSLKLINADTNEEIQTLTTGATINLATLPTKNLNIQAKVNSEEVYSVKFNLSGTQTRTVTESKAPYALFSDTEGEFHSWRPEVGSYTLKATPYLEDDGERSVGSAKKVAFQVINAPGLDQNTQDNISVYPNPATTKIFIQADKIAEGVTTIKLYDLAGDEVRSREVSDNNGGKLDTSLNVSGLEPGRYILTITTPQGFVTRQHIVVN